MLEKEIAEMLEKVDFLKSSLVELSVYEELLSEIDEKREELVKNINYLIDKLNKISIELNMKFYGYKKFLWEKEKEEGGGEVDRGNSKRTNK